MVERDPYQAPQTEDLINHVPNTSPFDPLLRSASWLRFIGGLIIVISLLSIISLLLSLITSGGDVFLNAVTVIISLFFVGIMMWLGCLLYSSGSSFKHQESEASIYNGADKLRLSIKIVGIIIAIYLILIVVAIAAAVIIPSVRNY